MEKGIALYKQGRFKEACTYFQNTEKGNVSLYYLGLCYTQLTQYDKAIHCFENVITISNDFAQVYQSRMVIGYVHSITGQYRLAESAFQFLIDQGFISSKVHAALGYVFFKQNNIPESIKHLEEALHLDSHNPTALNSLAFIMAHEKIQLSVALKYIRQALNIRPKNPAYLDTLAWVLFKSGENEKAYNILLKITQIAPQEEEIRSHLHQVEKCITY